MVEVRSVLSTMAKARAAAGIPKLVFRDRGVAKAEGRRKGSFKQSNVSRLLIIKSSVICLHIISRRLN